MFVIAVILLSINISVHSDTYLNQFIPQISNYYRTKTEVFLILVSGESELVGRVSSVEDSYISRSVMNLSDPDLYKDFIIM